MFEKIKESIARIARENTPFDPSSLNDPAAMRTDWIPLNKGGSSYRTHNLVSIGSDRLEFRATIQAKLIYLLFLFVGIGLLIMTVFENSSYFATLISGLTFAVAGGLMLYFGTAPIVFDKRKRHFWKGSRLPIHSRNQYSRKKFAAFNEIEAIQLISKYVSSSSPDSGSGFYSNELNLVLKSGQRINVVNHGDQNRLREDAITLSNFLKKPAWDALDNPIRHWD